MQLIDLEVDEEEIINHSNEMQSEVSESPKNSLIAEDSTFKPIDLNVAATDKIYAGPAVRKLSDCRARINFIRCSNI